MMIYKNEKNPVCNQKGTTIIFITFIIISAVILIGTNLVINATLNDRIAENYKKRTQLFYVSEGLMTLLAQEIIDGRAGEYTGIEPLLKLDFDEPSGQTVINSGTSALLFPYGTISQMSPVRTSNIPFDNRGKSLSFGTSTTARNSIDIPNNQTNFTEFSNLRSFTITGWLNCESSTEGTGGNCIISWASSINQELELVYKNDGSLQLYVNGTEYSSSARSSGGKIPSDKKISNGNWRFFAVTYDGTQESSNVVWYFGSPSSNASLDCINSYARGALGNSNTSGKLSIGNFHSPLSGNGRMFRGLIDQIQVFGSTENNSGVLTLADIIKVQFGAIMTTTIRSNGFEASFSVVRTDNIDEYMVNTEAYLKNSSNRPVAVSPLKQRISRYRKAHLDAGMIGGEGVDRWYNINTYDTNLVNDSLWLGGVLLRDTTKPLEIWHRGYDTNDDAKIMFIDKNGAEIFIFGVIPTTELTYRNLTAENIDNLAHGDTVYFKFYFQHENGNWWYTKGRYTGPNRLASDNLGWTAHDKYCSPEFRNTNLKFQTFPPYRRWFVADYLKDSDGYTTDTVELGVENFSFLDDDYDDLVFRVRGVCVNTMLTKIPESPARRSWRRSYGEND